MQLFDGINWILAFGCLAIPLLAMVGIRLFRVVRWVRSIRARVKELKERQKSASYRQSQAMAVVIDRCESILKDPFPDLPDEDAFREFVVSVAKEFYPEAQDPELRVSVGHLISTTRHSLDRFDTLLSRPGIRHLSNVRIGTLKKQKKVVTLISGFAPVRWYFRFQKWLAGLNVVRLLVIPDPFSWLLYLSGNLSIMVLTKCLLADLTLFVGETALALYGPQGDGAAPLPPPEGDEELEGLFEELGDLDDTPPSISKDPAILPMRKKITGFSALFAPTPTLSAFGDTLKESAEMVAQIHFPEADIPTDELRVGAVLQGTRRLLENLGKGEKIPVAGQIYKVRLDTLASIRRFADEGIPRRLKEMLTYGKDAYKWMTWLYRAWRLTSKGGLVKVAAGMGWKTAGKGVTLYLYGRVYDHALEEVDRVCRDSKK